jgi:hypothetical protein
MHNQLTHRRPGGKRLSTRLLSTFVCLVLLNSSTLHAESEREQKQAELDTACEAAREEILAPLRKQLVDECVQNKEQSDRAACEAYYSDYGSQSGDRAPLYYDIPECEKAFDYQNSQRQG